MDTLELLSKYDRPVPRYTSYPTAVKFHDGVNEKDYRNSLLTLESDDLVSLYIHIPFCHILCHYCGCHTKVVNSYSPVKAYVQNLINEIDLVGQSLNDKLSVSQIHFGGGSPNFLEAEEFEKIIQALKKYFEINEATEFALEADPRLLDNRKIEMLSRNGVNRISLGIQDFNSQVQKAVNRVQSFDKVAQCVTDLRSVGIRKINFDLMAGLPLQTQDTVTFTAEQAVSLSPDRIAVFAYAHVPWMKKQQKLLEKYTMPSTRERFNMILTIKRILEQSGYDAIGIDHFSQKSDSLLKALKSGRLRRNFQGYTDDQAKNIIGFGLSSISSFQGAYFQNTTNAPEYRRAIEEGRYPTFRGYLLSDDDVRRRELIEQIMCGYDVDVSNYPETRERLAKLERDGLIRISERGFIKLTPKGWPFARIVASCFDRYFVAQENQHTKAI